MTIDRFESMIKLMRIDRFPCFQADIDDRYLSSHVTTVLRLDRNTYLVGGYEQKGYVAAEVDANTLKIKRPVIEMSGILKNCLVYRRLALASVEDSTLIVTGLDTPPDERLAIEGYTLNDSAPGSTGCNMGRNMAIDRSKVYMTCIKSDALGSCYLVRANLGILDLSNLKGSRERLSLIEVAKVSKESSLHLGKSNIFLVEDRKITRVNKKTLKITELVSPIEGGEGNEGLVAVGTDKYAFVAKRNMMYLLRIGEFSVKKVAEVDTEMFTSHYTRMLVQGKFRSVSFVVRVMEYSTHIAIYAALKNSLFLIADKEIKSKGYMKRISGCMYDPCREHLILSLPYDMSVVIKLTY